MPPETCPVCGADVPPDAKACPHCGADDSTGWAEDAYAQELGLPDDSFDYEEFAREEFGRKPIRPRGVPWFWWLIALGLLIMFVAGLIRWR